MSKINTFLIGAQKAGTTSIYDWLGQHPDIEAPEEIKDFHFFTNPQHFKKGWEFIEKFYRKDKDIKVHGAVNYIYFSETAAKRLYEYNPEAKIIVCLRNPVERAISAYKYFIRTLQEDYNFSDALDRERNGLLNTYTELSNNTYVEHGFYTQQLADYIKLFPSENIHYVFFEELTNKQLQVDVMEILLTFLEVTPKDFKFSFSHMNFSGEPKYKYLNFLIKKSQFSKKIKHFIPFKLRKRLIKKVEQHNISTKKIIVDINEEERNFLKTIYSHQIDELSDLTGKDLHKLWNL